jgi:vacuolar-type H+-ATPase subunit I/STV1
LSAGGEKLTAVRKILHVRQQSASLRPAADPPLTQGPEALTYFKTIFEPFVKVYSLRVFSLLLWGKFSLFSRRDAEDAEKTQRELGISIKELFYKFPRGREAIVMEDKKTYLRKMAEQLEQLDAKVADLKAKAAKAGKEAAAEIDKKVAELSVKQQDARQKLQELKESGAEKWESLKSRVEKAREEVEGALNKILAKFKK